MKLEQMAERVHVKPGTLARSLLSTAIDDADPDPELISAILDGIPGRNEELAISREQISRGETISLDEFAARGDSSADA